MKKLVARLIGTYFNMIALFSPRIAGRKGFYLFCTPQRPALKKYHHDFLNTAEKLSFEHRGDTIQYYRWGTGKKIILFLHGWQSHSFRWKNYIEALSKDDFSIYAMDAPGHGLSGGRYLNLPVYSSAIENLLSRIPPVHAIVGHSLGSFATLHTFFRQPFLSVNQLVIMGTPGEVDEFMKYYQDTLGLSKRAMKAIYRSFEENNHHLPEYFSAATFAKAVTIPTLIIHDENDDETPYHHVAAIQKGIAKSRLITTSGLGHNLRSPEVVKHVTDFVMQTAKEYRMSNAEL